MLRGGLGLTEIPYAWYMRRRNRRYDLGQSKVERVGVPVVSVGNLTVGGTGKTPLVEWLARWFHARGVKVGIVSRGYGSKKGRPNDEALELASSLPDVPHVQNTDRVAAARAAIDAKGCELILLDDGFQHRRLHRDLDIVLLDALAPFGYGRLLPRGLLREPVSSLARAQVVCLSRADLIAESERVEIRERVRALAPDATCVELAHRPRGLLSSSGEEAPLASLAGRSIAAFCGIGNPAAFRASLDQCSYQVVAWREFQDHHPYDERDIAALAEWAGKGAAEAVVCTNKDLVKLNVPRLGKLPLWALSVGVEVLAGGEAVESRLGSIIAS